MIDFIKGPVMSRDLDGFVIEVSGVGFRIQSSAGSAAEVDVGEEALIFTELLVRDDSISLVGFTTREEREVYRMLTTVSGVGPRVALSILSAIRYPELCTAIATRDLKTLSTAPGVGKKTAERIAVDLSDKAQKIGFVQVHGVAAQFEPEDEDDAASALRALGYRPSEVQLMLSKVDRAGLSTEEVVSAALRSVVK